MMYVASDFVGRAEMWSNEVEPDIVDSLVTFNAGIIQLVCLGFRITLVVLM